MVREIHIHTNYPLFKQRIYIFLILSYYLFSFYTREPLTVLFFSFSFTYLRGLQKHLRETPEDTDYEKNELGVLAEMKGNLLKLQRKFWFLLICTSSHLLGYLLSQQPKN